MSTPHKCPICNGAGRVPDFSYMVVAGDTYISNSTEGKICNICEGEGVVYTDDKKISTGKKS